MTKVFTGVRSGRVKVESEDEEHDVNANPSPIRTVADTDTSARPVELGRVRDEVRAGVYCPPVEEVIERLAAFLAVSGPRGEVHRDAA